MHAARRARLRELITATGAPVVDAMLVTSLVDVRYLSGFSGSNAALLVPADDADDPLLATDGRYVTQADSESPDVPLVVARACAVALAEQAAGRGLLRLGVDRSAVTLALADDLRRAAPGVQLVPTVSPVATLRAVKDDDEIAAITEACRISDAALAASLASDRWVGAPERTVAARLEHRMRELGAEGTAFETIVGAGPNSAVPHHRPTSRPLTAGDLVVVDFGARVAGYHADMTRTFVVGPPADWQQEVFDVVRGAQRAGRAALRPGARCVDVDAAARDVVSAAGHAERFGHGLGHGVGLEIHEAPQVGPAATGTMAARMTVTVEPGIYLPERGGVRIEDTLVVGSVTGTAGGTSTALTTTARDLRVLD
jgi:Xaa-Pro aminopeptidase